MSLYHLLEGISTSDLDDLATQFADLVEARARTQNAVFDQALRASADAEAADAGAYQDRLTEELAAELQRLFPALREPLPTCPQGHTLDATNTLRLNGRRYCRTCANETTTRSAA